MSTLLQAFLLNWTAFLFGGFAFGKLSADRTRRIPVWARLASSLALTVAAWAWFLNTNGTSDDLYTFPIAIGMSLGLLGDLFMAGWIMGIPDPLGGMFTFGLGHIAYMIGMIRYGDALGYDDLVTRLGAWGIWLVIGVIGWLFSVRRFAKGKLRMFHWLALIYGLLLASTAGTATALALQANTFVPLAVGTGLFLFSDLLISLRLFGGLRFYLIEDVIWLTYGPAQALIVYMLAYAVV